MLVSIIIPTYQRPEFTREAIASVNAQTFQDFELIVICDGAEALGETGNDGRGERSVKYFNQLHKGVAAARNFGVSVSTGKYVAFLDSDDLWDRRKLEKQLAYLCANPEFKVCYTNEKWLRNGEHLNQLKKHKKHHGWIFDKCLPLCIISASSIIMERKVFEELGGFDENLPVCEDYDLWLRMSLKYPIAFFDEPLIIKRGGHADQLSKKYWGMDRFRIRALEKLLKNRLEPDKRALILAELEKKYAILLGGLFKRKRLLAWLYWQIKIFQNMMYSGRWSSDTKATKGPLRPVK